jgi:hypothetical protein
VSGAGGRGHGADFRRAWVAALDELEADVAEVERVLADDHLMRDFPAGDPWSPPEGLGPLPLDLRPRADAILTRQLAAAQGIALAITVNRRQAQFAAKVEAGDQGAPRPAYLDYAM